MRRKRVKERQSVFVGDEVETRTGRCTVIEYINSLKCVVRFEDGTLVTCRANDFLLGSVSNPFFPAHYGVGYIGAPRQHSDGAKSAARIKWVSMLDRCYGDHTGKNKNYVGCSVCPEWHNYQNFKNWFLSQKGSNEKGWHLDKDLIIKNNYEYSPKSCAIVPPEINYFLLLRENKRGSLPIGVIFHKNFYYAQMSSEGKQKILGKFYNIEDAFFCYKKSKEDEAKRLALKYDNVVEAKVIEALKNFVVSFND